MDLCHIVVRQPIERSSTSWPAASRPPKLTLIHLVEWSVKDLNTVLLEIAEVNCLVIEACKPCLVQASARLYKVCPLGICKLTDNPAFPRADIWLGWWSDMTHDIHDAAKLPLTPGLTDHRRSVADICRREEEIRTPQPGDDASSFN